jgi:hypothetical protein
MPDEKPTKSKPIPAAPERSLFRGSPGAAKAETPPSGISSDDGTPEMPPVSASDGPDSTSTTPGAVEQRLAEKAAAEPERAPHPYRWRIEVPAMIPFGFRDPQTGQPSPERIEAHIDDCWRAETAPEIAGVLVTRPKA